MGLSSALTDQLLDISGQGVIGGLAAHHVQSVQQMIGLNDIGLGLIQLVGHDQVIGVLLSVQSTLLQGHIQLAEVSGSGVGAQSLPVGDVVGILHGTDLDAGEIRHLADRLAAGHDAETGIGIAEQLQSAGFIGGLQLRQNGAVQHFPGGFQVGEHVGQVEQGGLRDIVHQRAGHAHDEVHGTGNAGLRQLRVTAQGAVFIQCHGDSTIRAIFDQLLKLGCQQMVDGILRSVGAYREAVSFPGGIPARLLLCSLSAAAGGQRQCHCQG